MKNLLRYILTLVIALSIVHLTKDILSFSREILMLKDHQLQAKVKKELMLHPTVKISSIALFASSPSGKGQYMAIAAATGVCLKYDIKTDKSLIVTNDHFCKLSKKNKIFQNRKNQFFQNPYY